MWIRRLRLGYCILLKVERMGLGMVYEVGANNKVKSRLMIVQHNRPTSIYRVRGSGVSVHAFGWIGEYV